MSERILVTGGSGFIAGHTILALLARGYAVRATVRDKDRIAPLEEILANNNTGGDVDFAKADLLDDTGWSDAMKGCDGVFHMASPFPMKMPSDPQSVIKPAVDGTLRVLDAANNAGIRRAVLTSSMVAMCYGRGGREAIFNEEDWTDPSGRDVTPYVQSKTLAERAAWDFVAKDTTNIALTAINPGLVFGPLLRAGHGTSVGLIRRMMLGRYPGAARIGFCVVDVRDVADMHVSAFESETAIGQRFACTDRWMWFREIGAAVKSAFPDEGRKAPTWDLPSFAIRLAATFDRSLKQILIELDQKRVVDSSKAKRVLAWSPRPADEPIRSTAESLIRFNLV